MAGDGEVPGKVTCAAWIRRPDSGLAVSSSRRLLVVYGRGTSPSSPPFLDLLAFDTRVCALDSEPMLRVVMGEEGADADTPRAIAVHSAADEFVCATAKGCRLFKLVYHDFCINLVSADSPPLQSVGPQRCLAFSTDGTKFSIGGELGFSVSSINFD